MPGKGYWMSIQNDAYMESHGKLNDGEVKIDVTKTNPTEATWASSSAAWDYTGNNLIGNPYHAYLDFDQFTLENPSFDSYYAYDADDGGGAKGRTNGGYVMYVKGGSRGGYYASRYLHPHQGFFVQTTSNKEVKFENTGAHNMAVTRSVAGSSHFRGDDQPEYPLVNLFAYDREGRADVLVVEFFRPENAGGKKVKSLRNGNHLLYAHNDTTDYGAFFAVDTIERVPVRFHTFEEKPTTYTLTWELQNGGIDTLYLVDNLMGVAYDMIAHNSYVFTSAKTDYLSRFYITFHLPEEEAEGAEPADPSPFAYFNGIQWVIEGKGRLELYDETGRLLQKLRLSDYVNHLDLSSYAKGVYLLRLVDTKTVRTQKIIKP